MCIPKLLSLVVWFLFIFIGGNCMAGPFELQDFLKKKDIWPKGEFYEATIPDTLDLAEHARLAINMLTNTMNTDPALDYASGSFNFGQDPPLCYGQCWEISCINLTALPWLRTMCGSDQNLDLEYKAMQSRVRQISEDGLMFIPITAYGLPKDTSYPVYNGYMALATANWYERDANGKWLEILQSLSNGFKKIAIEVNDRAYYPIESGITKDGEWKWTLRGPDRGSPPYTPPEEPVSDHQGCEMAVKWQFSKSIEALAMNYHYNKDRDSLDLANKFTRFCMKPGMWDNPERAGNEHGQFSGHFIGNIEALRAFLYLAKVENDEYLKRIVREAYNHSLTRGGVAKIGAYRHENESCDIMGMLSLAVTLSDAGIGDYWDDVDYVVRNHLVEQQFTNLNLMREVSGIKPGTESDEILKRFLGGFGLMRTVDGVPQMFHCCSPNGGIGLYYAWHGITRFHKGIATVNLFLNRVSPWMDIDSYLPYEGKVVLRNKKANIAMVRIPGWLDIEKVRCTVNKKSVTPARSGRYLVFDKLKKKDKIVLDFPVTKSVRTYTMFAGVPKPVKSPIKFNVTFRGSTVVDIEPRDVSEYINEKEGWAFISKKMYPIYQREHMKATDAPMRKVRRFVADKILPLQ